MDLHTRRVKETVISEVVFARNRRPQRRAHSLIQKDNVNRAGIRPLKRAVLHHSLQYALDLQVRDGAIAGKVIQLFLARGRSEEILHPESIQGAELGLIIYVG